MSMRELAVTEDTTLDGAIDAGEGGSRPLATARTADAYPMKISIARMITNLAARGRALGNRFAWWSRWFPPATTVDADRFQGDRRPLPRSLEGIPATMAC